MSLPELREVPEDLDDEKVFEFIVSTFEEIRSAPEPPQIDFNKDLAWLLKVIVTRATDKAAVLFQCGMIFLNPYVAFNASILSKTLGYSSADTVTRRTKTWTQASWDSEDKARLIAAYDPGCETKGWTVRIPPHDSVVFHLSVFKPMEQIEQRVPQINEIPAPVYKGPMIVNVDQIVARRKESAVIASVEPVRWKFDTTPLYAIDFMS